MEGPIGGGRLTGVGGGKLDNASGNRRLVGHDKHQEPTGDRRASRASRDVPKRTATRRPNQPRPRGHSPVAIMIWAMLVMFLLAVGLGAIIEWRDEAHVERMTFEDDSDWFIANGTIYEEFADEFDSDGFLIDDDPTACVDIVDGTWSGAWGSNAGAASGGVDVELRSSGTTIEGQVVLTGDTSLGGGSLSGVVDCRTVSLTITDYMSVGTTISFTGTLGAEGSTMQGVYSASTMIDGYESVLDDGKFFVARS